jgi:hypothetical protein
MMQVNLMRRIRMDIRDEPQRELGVWAIEDAVAFPATKQRSAWPESIYPI